MDKKTTSLTIDREIISKMKENGMNMSEIAENAMKVKLGEVVIKPKEAVCHYCGKKGELSTAKNPDDGMMWLCPAEHWICQQCNINKVREVIGRTY